MPPAPLPFSRLLALDKTVHEPARLAILTALSACRSASFTYLLALTALTHGNLHVHLSKLRERGFVETDKEYAGGYSNTDVRLTAAGRRALAEHWEQLSQLKRFSSHPSAADDDPPMRRPTRGQARARR